METRMNHKSDKPTVRKTMLAARKHHHQHHRDRAAAALVAQFDAAHLTPETHPVVACYAATGSELDTAPLMQHLARRGFCLALPFCQTAEQPAQFRAYQPGDTLASDGLGVAAPVSAQSCQPDIIFLPLVAVDAGGRRLGRGGGTYDRTLADLRAKQHRFLAIGLAYDMQVIDVCPTDPHDQKLDAVISEQRYIACAARRG
jgi:5-formyltetrahydrofolate cyclo-ligase